MEPRRGSIRPRSDLVVAKARHQPDPLRQLQRQGLVAAPDPAFAEAALGRDPLVVLEQRLDLAVVHEGCPEHQLAQETLAGGGCDDDFGHPGLHEPSEIAEAPQAFAFDIDGPRPPTFHNKTEAGATARGPTTPPPAARV